MPVRRILIGCVAALLVGSALMASGGAGLLFQASFKPSGGTARTAFSKLSDQVSVKDFGATGNGNTDDTAAINACLASNVNGVTCYMPAGSYRITSAINPPQNTTLKGAGGPIFTTEIIADGTAAFQMLGAGRSGGFAFRIYLRDFSIEMVNTPSTTKIIEINTAYSIDLDHVRIHNLPDNSSVGVNVVDSNDINLRKLTVYGAAKLTNNAVFVQGVGTTACTVHLIEPDIEVVKWGIRAFGGAQVDILFPYMEQFTIGVDNQSATGRVTMIGGTLQGINSGTFDVEAIAGSHTVILGTRLNPGSSTHTLFSTASGAIISWLDDQTGNFYTGTSVAAADVTPGALGFTPPTVTFANIGTPANGSTLYCSDCTIANPCAGVGSGAIAKRLNGVWVCN